MSPTRGARIGEWRPTFSADELVCEPGPETNCFVVIARVLELREDVLDAGRFSVRVHVDVRASDVEHGHHFLYTVWDLEGVDVAGRLEGVVALLGPPRVLKLMPATPQCGRVDAAGMAVARENSGLAHSKDVDEVALAD